MTRPLKTAIPIPQRMAHLKRDPRGYPIPAMVLIDDGGRPHFQINDERIRQRLIAQDRCVICGGRLFRGRWFIGGALSAFSERGLYIDPPTHAECAEFALKVCPYLAAPHYGRELAARTMKGRTAEGVAVVVDDTTLSGRPLGECFVAVMAVRQDLIRAQGQFWRVGFEAHDVRYVRHAVGGAREVQVWRHGARITDPGELARFYAGVSDQLAAEYDGERGRADMWALVGLPKNAFGRVQKREKI